MTDRPKLLTVDDRPENLLALRTVLADLDVEIVEASSGNAALTATLSHDFAVAILDVQMPGMDGFELAELLRGDPKTCSVPIIFLTAAYREEAQIFKGYEAGAVDYIVKPYSPQVLRSKVTVFLELHHRSHALAEKVVALAASEERFRSLVMTVPDIVYRIDPEGRFTFVNDAVTHLGYTPGELIGTHFSEIMLPAEVKEVSRDTVLPQFAGKVTRPEVAPKLFDERRTAGRKTTGLEVRLVQRQGGLQVPGLLHSLGPEAIPVEVNASGLYSSVEGRGSPVFLGTVGIIRDISERKRTMEELERHRGHLQDLVGERVKEQACLYKVLERTATSMESALDLLRGVVRVLPEGLRYPEIACARLTLDGHTAITDRFEETPWCLAVAIEVAGEPRGRAEVFYREHRSGEAGPFLPEEHEAIKAIARAIGQGVERRQLQLQVVQSQRMESIGTLASGVAHEINNPLNIVMNFAQLIQDEAGTPDAAREYAATIVEESLRMAGIVRNLLAFSRNEKESHSPADVTTLVHGTLTLIGAALRKDQVEVAAQIPEGLPKVHCRSQQIQQVLLNLLTNARDALNARFPGAHPDKVVRVDAAAFEREGQPWVRISVEDRAGGIPSDVAAHVFEPFFTTKSRDQGTGLGLSISYGLVKEHEGLLWFENEPGVGTRFHVDLKVENSWSAPHGAQADTTGEEV
ncbi:MAG: response regulator [Pseudomonadota bacterium]